MKFVSLVVRRVLSSALTLVLVSIAIFCAVEVLPGDIPSRILGREAPEAAKERLRQELNLDAPLVERYVDWAGGAIRGDFGEFISARKPVTEVLKPRIANTLMLSGLAMLFYIPLSILPAVLQARRPDRALDRMISATTILILSIPEFLLATLMLFALAVSVPIFPPMAQVSTADSGLEMVYMILLPALTLALLLATYGVRLLRESSIEIMHSDFVRMAALKGLSSRRILWRHALPNAITPWLNATALNIAFLIGGVVVVEKVFVFPGFGSMLVDALQLRDVPLIEAGVLVAGAAFILVNLAADIATMALNPKLRV